MLQTGLGASVFAGGFGQASLPTAAGATPQGPRTVGQQAFGIVAGDTGGGNGPVYAVIGGGGLALTALLFIWWSLPR